MLLLNLSTSLCTSPTMHRTMSMVKRAECAMSGFVLLDLWKIVADKIAFQRGVAKGSLYMANQTRSALQSVAMSVILIALTKDELGDPFLPWTCPGHRAGYRGVVWQNQRAVTICTAHSSIILESSCKGDACEGCQGIH